MRANVFLISVLTVPLLGACKGEPRSAIYFEKHPDEARAVIADTKNCLGLDETKVIGGTDECTNAHFALRKIRIREYNETQRKADAESIRNGTFMPKLKQ